MARALTWRNVTGASAGNPSSALAAASSAFGSASRGALDTLDSIRTGQDRANEQATQQAIAGILGSGKPLDGSTLQNFAPGVDVDAVVDSVMGYRKGKQDLSIGAQELNQLQYENSPERREFLTKQEQLRTENLQETLEIRKAELARLQANDAESQRRADGVLAIQRGYNSTDPNGLRGRAMASVEVGWGQVQQQFLSSERIKNLTPEQQQIELQAALGPEARERFVQQEMSRLAPSWLAEQQAQWGLDESDLGKTTLGRRLQTIEASNTKAITEEQARQRTEASNARKAAEKALENGNLAAVVPSGSGFELGKAKENTLGVGALPSYLAQDMNIDIDPNDIKKAEKVLEAVGGNKKKFAEIMSSNLLNRDRGWVPGDNDDVNWAGALSDAKTEGDRMRSWLREQTIENAPADPRQMSFQDILNNQLRESAKPEPTPKTPEEAAQDVVTAAPPPAYRPPLPFSLSPSKL